MSKVLFWDFDGTLVHTDTKWSNALYDALNNIGCAISVDEVGQHLRAGYTWHTPEIEYPNSTGQKWWNRLFEHFNQLYINCKLTDNDMAAANNYLRKQILDPSNYTLYDDTISVLSNCIELGYENYILSNNFPELSLVLDGLKLSKYFKDYIVSANIGYEKPRIEIFQYALNLAQSPEICYMIGDNPVADIQGGKAAGMTTILVHKDGSYDTDYMCNTLMEIPSLLI